MGDGYLIASLFEDKFEKSRDVALIVHHEYLGRLYAHPLCRHVSGILPSPIVALGLLRGGRSPKRQAQRQSPRPVSHLLHATGCLGLREKEPWHLLHL
jgi:hypothetical protein